MHLRKKSINHEYILNNGKMEDKSNSDHRIKSNGDMLKDSLLFSIYVGLFLCFLFLIWNYDSGNLDFGTSGYNFVISIFIVIIIFMILWKTRK